MGTRITSLANNFDTTGKLKAAGINNASLSGITALPAGVAGKMTLLSTQTASASASLSFTSGIDSTYDEYWFVFNNVHPATDNVSFDFNGSTDSGSTYSVTKTTTLFRSGHDEADTFTQLGYNSNEDLAQSTSYQHIVYGLGNDNDQCVSGVFKLYNPSSTTYVKHFTSTASNYFASNGNNQMNVAGYFNTTSAIDAIDFKMSSGNIDDGTIRMYGVSTS